jgi:hypothetical protein
MSHEIRPHYNLRGVEGSDGAVERVAKFYFSGMINKYIKTGWS